MALLHYRTDCLHVTIDAKTESENGNIYINIYDYLLPYNLLFVIYLLPFPILRIESNYR